MHAVEAKTDGSASNEIHYRLDRRPGGQRERGNRSCQPAAREGGSMMIADYFSVPQLLEILIIVLGVVCCVIVRMIGGIADMREDAADKRHKEMIDMVGQTNLRLNRIDEHLVNLAK
jgi:hypothetical protein